MDGKTVPLVYQHLHNDPKNILGHALLENRADGVYAYCSLNGGWNYRLCRTSGNSFCVSDDDEETLCAAESDAEAIRVIEESDAPAVVEISIAAYCGENDNIKFLALERIDRPAFYALLKFHWE